MTRKSDNAPDNARGGLLDTLLDEASASQRAEDARGKVGGLVGSVREAVSRDSRDAADARVEAAATAAFQAAALADERSARSASAGRLIGAVVDRVRADAPTSSAPSDTDGSTRPTSSEGGRRIRRPEERFDIDALTSLGEGPLLALVTRMDPTDIVLVCASRGAGDLCDRLLALLPDGTRQALFEAIKAAGITPDDEASAALGRVATLYEGMRG